MFSYTEFVQNHGILLAPLAGVSDVAFRQMCVEHGAQMTFSEMVSAKGLSYANERTVHLIDMAPNEDRIGVQLFGHEPETMASQAAWIEQHLGERLAVIDVNMGCPARKIVSKGDGCALMKDLPLAQSIVEAIVGAVSTPVTVKMRRAYEVGPDTAPELARRAELAGASAVTIHGRYATQMYRGASCWDVIRNVKESVSIPVIGNGDIRCGSDAVEMIHRTDCDSVMIARGAEGNPWIFQDVFNAFCEAGLAVALDGEVPGFTPPSAYDRIEAARKQTLILHELEPRSVIRMRKHASWYVKGLPGASVARGAFNQCNCYEDFCDVYDKLIQTVREFEEVNGLLDPLVVSGLSEE